MNKLKELLIQYGCPEGADLIEETFDADNCSFKALSEIIIKQGTILEEIETDRIYIATIKVSFNNATIAVQIKRGKVHILSYAKEGIIKQNTALKAVERIKKEISPSNEKNSGKKKLLVSSRWIFIASSIIVLAVVALVASALIACDSIKNYNHAAEEFNSYVDEYNNAVSKTSVDNIQGLPSSIEKINIESDSVFEGFSVVFGKNSIAKISADTDKIYELVEQLENSLKIIEQITSPSGEWVEERIKNVDEITGTQAVTDKNNPDGLLNKEGGYSACIYFSVDKIDSNSIKGNDIVEKGTDAGGSVEVYDTLEEAEARCEYLSEFDGTILYSGSYAIVGTNVIRTSYLLTNEEQFELTDKITQALTKKL